MNIFKKNNEKKTTQKLPMTGKVKKGFRAYCAVIAAATLVCGMSVTAFAASDPITVVNNLSDFIFGWCCIIKVDTLFSRILIYNHNQYENRRKTYGTESKIL